MYKYAGDISHISHNIILSYCRSFEIGVDGTLGNGYDTDFLSANFGKVYSFEIQKHAIDKYKDRKSDNINLIWDSHENFKQYIHEEVDCIMYNLGFLPGGDKSVTTKSDSTINSIKTGLSLLKPGGIMSIAVYTGHDEGKKEEKSLLHLTKSLSKSDYGVLLHTFVNRINSPQLFMIEKNLK